ncbi:uncharacterized protein LOC117321972 [Pecten maximus]|uniref:uncharacterized protein LOC117321972 n=1 Tax=Pecten maximus TaxID=6579 RepID=UPI001458D1F4|nr:uncharacterized protein LOC117321972 [Pecten maximus]
MKQGKLCGICCCCEDVNSRIKFVSQNMGSDCAICLEEKNLLTKSVVVITCNHTYHAACIRKSLEMDRSARCPQCRQQLGQYSSTERFIAIIQTLVRKRKERTLEVKARKWRPKHVNEEKENTALENTYLNECSSYIPSTIPPEGLTYPVIENTVEDFR